MNLPAITLRSFAKINWSLQVLAKRPDGYHEVRTLLQTISLHDDLHFRAREDDEILLSCNAREVPTDGSNLIIRAAYALKAHYRVYRGARIQLTKRIPLQAGLGGASANAAVALLALVRLWNIEVTAPAILDIAARLGADVPFFLHGGCALASGIGATVSALPDRADSAPKHLIVITPNVGISTAAAYARLSSAALTTRNTDPILSSSHTDAKSRHSQPWPVHDEWNSHLPGDLKNDFESVIFDIEPEIRRTKEALLQAGALGALLAGSGSSVFGVFADREAQQLALKEIQAERGWRIFPCVTLSRDEYHRLMGSERDSLFRFFEQRF